MKRKVVMGFRRSGPRSAAGSYRLKIGTVTPGFGSATTLHPAAAERHAPHNRQIKMGGTTRARQMPSDSVGPSPLGRGKTTGVGRGPVCPGPLTPKWYCGRNAGVPHFSAAVIGGFGDKDEETWPCRGVERTSNPSPDLVPRPRLEMASFRMEIEIANRQDNR